MHFYTHNIGEFAIETKFMSFEEKGIYVELVDRYLATGKPLASDWLATVKRFASEGAVEAVLATCFVRDGDVYRSEQLDRMIEEYGVRSEKNRENARKPRKKAEKSTAGEEIANGKQIASESLTTNNYKPITNNQELSSSYEVASEKKRAPLVAMPAELPAEWEASALEARPDVDPRYVYGKIKAKYAGATTRKAMSTWRREFLNWIGREFARSPAPAPKPVKKFTDEYYLNSLNPDGSVNWGI